MTNMIGAMGNTVDGARVVASEAETEMAMQEAETLRSALTPARARTLEADARHDHVPNPEISAAPKFGM